MMRPNFFLIGAPRCGTSSLYEGIRQHPEIYMSPVKEPWYFSIGVRSRPFQGPKDADYNLYLSRSEYDDLFSGARGERVVGEASTDYLYSESALNALHTEFPTAKLAAILRNPADRAYSQYVQHVSQLREPCERFWDAVELEEERKRLDWCHYWYYRSLGFYGRQLARYFEYFAPGQIKVFLFDDLRSDPSALYRELFEFLDVDASFEPEISSGARNESALPASRRLHAMLTQPSTLRSVARSVTPRSLRVAGLKWAAARRQTVEAPGLSPEERRSLIDTYRDDIALLESLIGRDLSAWRDVSGLPCER